MYTGQRTRPPALFDISPDARARVKKGMPYHSTARHMGVRKQTKPKISIQICARLDSLLEITSTFTCSPLSSV